MNPIKVVIADDSEHFVREMSRQIMYDPRMELMGTARSGDELCRLIRKERPDIVSLDIILPRMDGFSVMDTILRDKSLKEVPAFLVVSAVGREQLQQAAFDHGACFFLQKPVDPRILANRMTELGRKPAAAGPAQNRLEETRTVYYSGNTKKDITSVLRDLGVPAHLKGYQYLRDGIELVVERPERIQNITKCVYDEVAGNWNMTPGRVERAIRHAIGVSWTRGRMPLLDRLYGYGGSILDEKPTNSEFIAVISDKLSLEYKREYTEKEHTEKEHTEKERTEKEHTEKERMEKEHTDKECTEKEHTEKEHTDKEHTDEKCTDKKCTDKECTDKECTDNEHMEKAAETD